MASSDVKDEDIAHMLKSLCEFEKQQARTDPGGLYGRAVSALGFFNTQRNRDYVYNVLRRLKKKEEKEAKSSSVNVRVNTKCQNDTHSQQERDPCQARELEHNRPQDMSSDENQARKEISDRSKTCDKESESKEDSDCLKTCDEEIDSEHESDHSKTHDEESDSEHDSDRLKTHDEESDSEHVSDLLKARDEESGIKQDRYQDEYFPSFEGNVEKCMVLY